MSAPQIFFQKAVLLRAKGINDTFTSALQCKHCGKAFASHAAHDSHVRRTHSKDKLGDINMNKADDTIDVVGYDPMIAV